MIPLKTINPVHAFSLFKDYLTGGQITSELQFCFLQTINTRQLCVDNAVTDIISTLITPIIVSLWSIL